MKKGSIGLGILIGILLVVVLTALAVGLLLSGNWLYESEIGRLNIEQSSGLPKEVILENYSAVTRFLSPFYSGEFEMPSLAWSPSGAQHFEEVKTIVLWLYGVGLACFAAIASIFLLLRKKLGRRSYLATAITTLALPLLIGVGIALDFDGFFVLFHKIFFNNDYWVFNPAADPVITILPSDYFMHCAIFIALLWAVGSIVFFLLFLRRKKRDSDAEIPA